MRENENAQNGQEGPSSNSNDAITVIARRLKSQPLLFGFAILFLLVAVAGTAIDALKILQWPAIIIFVLGSAVWLIAEYLYLKSQKSATATSNTEKRPQESGGADLRVQAKRVAKSGSVSLVEGAPSDMKIDSLDADVEDIHGSVKGVVYQEGKKKDGESTDN